MAFQDTGGDDTGGTPGGFFDFSSPGFLGMQGSGWGGPLGSGTSSTPFTFFDEPAGGGVLGAGNEGLDNLVDAPGEDPVRKNPTKFGMGGMVSTGLGVGSALVGWHNADRLARSASQPAPIYDPGAGIRGPAQAALNRLTADPSGELANLPGYKAGLDAVTRKMAAAGYLGSGNMMAGLLQYGGDIFNKEALRLGELAGAKISPLVAGDAPWKATSQAAELRSRSLATLGNVAKNFKLEDWGIGGT